MPAPNTIKFTMTSIQAKINRHTKEENTIYHEKNQSTEKYSYMTDLLYKEH